MTQGYLVTLNEIKKINLVLIHTMFFLVSWNVYQVSLSHILLLEKINFGDDTLWNMLDNWIKENTG